MIVRRKGGWVVLSHDGEKKLGGPYKSKKQAQHRLLQVEYFKRHKK